MRLVNAAKIIKKGLYIFFGFILVFYFIFEVGPSLMKSFFPPAPVEKPILYKFSPIVFSTVKDYPSGENGIDVSESNIIYRRNANLDWNSLPSKSVKLYTLNTDLPEDLDYLTTAKSVASFLGYGDSSLISTGISDNNYIWEVPEDNIQFTINKKNKKMEQRIKGIVRLKNYLTAGEFVNAEFVNNKVTQFLINSRKFTSDEIKTVNYETTYWRFENENLIESPILGAELAKVKIYIFKDGKRIVGNNYEAPSNFMFISSLRPEIAESKKNYRYPRFILYKNELTTVFNGEEFDLEPLPNAIQRVVDNKDFVIRGITFNDLPLEAPKPKNFKIENISIESFEVAYFDDYEEGFGKNPLVQPIYLFRGNFDTNTGQRGKIILYTPAVNPKYYN